MHTHKGLARVEYRSPVTDLPGVPFDVRYPAGEVGDLHWSVLRMFDAEGGPTGFTVQLLDRRERAVMEASYGAGGGLDGITKSAYDPSGELRYLFDYDATGKLVDIYDRAEARNPPFEEVLGTLADRALFADGWALPAGVAPGSLEEVVRRADRGRR